MSAHAQPSDEARLVRLQVNGQPMSGVTEPRTLLVDFIRHDLGLRGTHVGCEQGVCGACTIRMDGEMVRSCIIFAVQADGSSVETIEGLANGAELHPIQEAFRETHGLQCGFCTPGMVLAAQRLLEENPHPTESEVREYMSGNICRCTGYVGIVDAVLLASQSTASGEQS
jgi:aerobic-type carbon monoxide dehydrogenase small subunit (CoxS/CutS family)